METGDHILIAAKNLQMREPSQNPLETNQMRKPKQNHRKIIFKRRNLTKSAKTENPSKILAK